MAPVQAHCKRNLLPRDLTSKSQTRWLKKRMLVAPRKPRWRKVNSSGWQMLLARKSTCLFIILFRSTHFCYIKWDEQYVKILCKMWAYLFAFAYHVLVKCWLDPENWHGWSPGECWGWAGGLALVSTLNIWVPEPVLMRTYYRLQDIRQDLDFL